MDSLGDMRTQLYLNISNDEEMTSLEKDTVSIIKAAE